MTYDPKMMDTMLASTSERGQLIPGFSTGFRRTWTAWDGQRQEVPLDQALVVSSETYIDDVHRPVLDIDYPAQLVPSTTPGHHHLYLDVDLSWRRYKRLLNALAEADVIEPGFAQASITRGASFARLPWVRKV